MSQRQGGRDGQLRLAQLSIAARKLTKEVLDFLMADNDGVRRRDGAASLGLA